MSAADERVEAARCVHGSIACPDCDDFVDQIDDELRTERGWAEAANQVIWLADQLRTVRAKLGEASDRNQLMAAEIVRLLAELTEAEARKERLLAGCVAAHVALTVQRDPQAAMQELAAAVNDVMSAEPSIDTGATS